MTSSNQFLVGNQALETVLQTMLDGLIIIDDHGSVQTFNSAAEKIFGYQSAEVIGKNIKMLMPDNYRQEHDSYLRHYLKTGEKHVIETVRAVSAQHKNGKIFPVELTVNEMCLNGKRLFVGTIHNISKRREAERLSATILASTKHLIISMDPEGIITSFNKGAEEALGYQAEEVVGIYTPALWHDQHEVVQRAAELTESLEEFVEPSFEVFVIKPRRFHPESREWTFHCKDGSTLLCNQTVTCIRDDHDNIIGYLGTIEDVTERKKAELEREQLVERLTDSNEELERFAYVCSHDLQEPLRMIRSFSSLLSTHLSAQLANDEAGQKYIQFITDGATRAQNLIAGILNYASIDRDTQQKEEVDLVDLIEHVKQNLYLNLQEYHGKVTYDHLPKIKGNKTQLYQLLGNLINNGLKYQKPGSNPKVHISCQDDGAFWRFSVQDNGIGVARRYLTRVFEVFHRLHTREEYPGSGVGLAICKKVVGRHGGKIWVESEEGHGATFYFTILKLTQTETAPTQSVLEEMIP